MAEDVLWLGEEDRDDPYMFHVWSPHTVVRRTSRHAHLFIRGEKIRARNRYLDADGYEVVHLGRRILMLCTAERMYREKSCERQFFIRSLERELAASLEGIRARLADPSGLEFVEISEGVVRARSFNVFAHIERHGIAEQLASPTSAHSILSAIMPAETIRTTYSPNLDDLRDKIIRGAFNPNVVVLAHVPDLTGAMKP